MTEQSSVGTDHYCPNCGEGGTHDLSQADFEEWRCTNHNCQVHAYYVEPGTDRSGGGDSA